jgi:hypothetical protein
MKAEELSVMCDAQVGAIVYSRVPSIAAQKLGGGYVLD